MDRFSTKAYPHIHLNFATEFISERGFHCESVNKFHLTIATTQDIDERFQLKVGLCWLMLLSLAITTLSKFIVCVYSLYNFSRKYEQGFWQWTTHEFCQKQCRVSVGNNKINYMMRNWDCTVVKTTGLHVHALTCFAYTFILWVSV